MLENKIKHVIIGMNHIVKQTIPVYLFGTGELSEIVLKYLNTSKIKPLGYFDNDHNRVGEKKNDLLIENPAYKKNVKVFIASSFVKEIYSQLLTMGYQPEDIIELDPWKLPNLMGIYQYAPYCVDIYRTLLTSMRSSQNVSFKILSKNSPVLEKINVFLRHDIDTLACAQKLKLLINIEKEVGVLSTVYIRTDRLEYDPRILQSSVKELKKSGFEIGLHTGCYLSDKFWDRFAEETASFSKIFGFAPRSFTVHGMGTFRSGTRQLFIQTIQKKMDRSGYSFSDEFDLKYSYRIRDCYGGPEFNKRCILEDYKGLPLFFYRGNSYSVLTHPVYWEQ